MRELLSWHTYSMKDGQRIERRTKTNGIPRDKTESSLRQSHGMRMICTAVFDSKAYDRESLQRASSKNKKVDWRFLDFRLTPQTAPLANGCKAVCVFVNDQVDRRCLGVLARQGVKLVALRCTGFNNVDVAAAKALKLTVTRVPVYSPHAVAEHAMALLLTLNRKV